jgi:hypothetical protein
MSMKWTVYYSSPITAGEAYFSDCYCKKATSGELIVDGAVTADKILANSITAGQIAAGAIGADEIAANTIAAKHMLIGGWGAGINANPACDDLTAWADYSNESNPPNASIATITDGKVGNKTLSGALNTPVNIVEKRFYPVDPSKVYRVRCWCREASSPATNGTFYLALDLYDENGARISGGGTFWYYPADGVSVPTAWTYYYGRFGPGTTKGAIPSNARTMRLAFLTNYGGNSGRHQIQDARIEEVVPGELIVDGSITAAKITAGAISTDKLDVVNMVANDGSYLVSVGWYLNSLTTQYPSPTSGLFTADGRIHGYRWDGSNWVEYLSIGDTGSNVIGVLSQIAGRNGFAVTVHGASADAILGACNSDATDGIGVRGVSDSGTGYGVWGESNGNIGVYGYGGAGYGGHFNGGKAPLVLYPSASASAPSHTAAKGSLWVTSAGVLYINTDGGTTWAKVGAQ